MPVILCLKVLSRFWMNRAIEICRKMQDKNMSTKSTASTVSTFLTNEKRSSPEFSRCVGMG